MESTEERIREIEQKPIRDGTVEELKILDEVWKKNEQAFKEREKQHKKQHKQMMKEINRSFAKIHQGEFGETLVYLLGNFLRCCGWFFVVFIGIFIFFDLLRGKTENFLQGIVIIVIAYIAAWVGVAMIKPIEELWELRKEKVKK